MPPPSVTAMLPYRRILTSGDVDPLPRARHVSAGYGGIAAVSRATGIAASTIGRGLKELVCGPGVPADRVRRHGGGRKALVETNATLLDDLLALVSPSERGDPMSPLRWTCK